MARRCEECPYYTIEDRFVICTIDNKIKQFGQECDISKKILMHKDICKQLNKIYVEKNSDYGDSFRKVRSKYPNAILIRLNDKLNRLETLLNGQVQNVKEESIEDTLLDLANYALMELVERKLEKE